MASLVLALDGSIDIKLVENIRVTEYNKNQTAIYFGGSIYECVDNGRICRNMENISKKSGNIL